MKSQVNPRSEAASLSQLPACVIWQLLYYLDTPGIVALASVNNTLRHLVTVSFNLSVSVPFTTSYSNQLLADPYSHNKPVLRMRICRLSPDFIRLDKILHSSFAYYLPISRQLLLLNLSSLTNLCLHLEQTEYSDVETYRVAFLAMLQSTGMFKHLSKFHLTVPHTFLLNLAPENFGTRLMKDALAVDHLVITLMKKKGVEIVDTGVNSRALENFFSSVRSRRFVLNFCSFDVPTKKNTMATLTNDHIEQLKLIAPCHFQAKLKMRKLEELSISTSDQQCPLHKAGHQVGKCVLNRAVVAQGCPNLQEPAGVGMKDMMEREAQQKKLRKRKKAKIMRCGACAGCRVENCGVCRNCSDMKRFGGKGRLRQACEDRKCGGREELECEESELPIMSVQTWRSFISCCI